MLRRSPMPRRKQPMSRTSSAIRRSRERIRRTRLRKVGNNAHSKDWRRRWPKLKAGFERAGITRCERCGSDYFLTPAHSLKRRHITNDAEMDEVALLCQPCHDHFELQGEAKMYPAIRALIADRPNKMMEAA